MSSKDGVRVTSVDAYLPLESPPSRLTIRADSMVATVVLDADRATGVRLVDGTEIHADRVVLAAGTYGSPTILMRSGIGPAGQLRGLGIDVLVDLPGVGENLADHPAVDLDSGWRGPAVSGPVLHSIATFRSPDVPAEGAPDLMFWVSDPAGDEPGLLVRPDPAQATIPRIGPAPVVRPRGTTTHLAARPSRAARRRATGRGVPARAGARQSPRDSATVDRGGAIRTGDSAEARRRVLDNAYSVPHVVGTCAMGPSPEGGDVVDALGRVHGVERLSVVDASIIPEPRPGSRTS